jgi:hypothetical protein
MILKAPNSHEQKGWGWSMPAGGGILKIESTHLMLYILATRLVEVHVGQSVLFSQAYPTCCFYSIMGRFGRCYLTLAFLRVVSYCGQLCKTWRCVLWWPIPHKLWCVDPYLYLWNDVFLNLRVHVRTEMASQNSKTARIGISSDAIAITALQDKRRTFLIHCKFKAILYEVVTWLVTWWQFDKCLDFELTQCKG